MKATKAEFATIMEAMRRAQAELAVYLGSRDCDAELAIAKLVGILDQREVVRAMKRLDAANGVNALKRAPVNSRRDRERREFVRRVPDPAAVTGRGPVPVLSA
jgi:hypothetical protein